MGVTRDIRADGWSVRKTRDGVTLSHHGRIVAVMGGRWIRPERLVDIPLPVLRWAMDVADSRAVA